MPTEAHKSFSTDILADPPLSYNQADPEKDSLDLPGEVFIEKS